MFEYNTPHAKGLREFFASCHRDNALVQFAGEEFSTTATLSDGTNIIRAILVIADTMESDEFERMFEDIANGVDAGIIASAFPVIAEEFSIAMNGYDIVENADGSAHAIPATVTVSDTATVTTRHADGTVTVSRQTVADAHAVIADGHARLIALAENGDIETDFSDLHEFETLTESE